MQQTMKQIWPNIYSNTSSNSLIEYNFYNIEALSLAGADSFNTPRLHKTNYPFIIAGFVKLY